MRAGSGQGAALTSPHPAAWAAGESSRYLYPATVCAPEGPIGSW